MKGEAYLKYPVRSCPTPDKSYVAVKVSELDELETERDEMFKALIKTITTVYDWDDWNNYLQGVIEKATDKPWEEIKELSK